MRAVEKRVGLYLPRTLSTNPRTPHHTSQAIRQPHRALQKLVRVYNPVLSAAYIRPESVPSSVQPLGFIFPEPFSPNPEPRTPHLKRTESQSASVSPPPSFRSACGYVCPGPLVPGRVERTRANVAHPVQGKCTQPPNPTSHTSNDQEARPHAPAADASVCVKLRKYTKRSRHT